MYPVIRDQPDEQGERHGDGKRNDLSSVPMDVWFAIRGDLAHVQASIR
jgi:hypothetical protein